MSISHFCAAVIAMLPEVKVNVETVPAAVPAATVALVPLMMFDPLNLMLKMRAVAPSEVFVVK